jgi:catechol 2,3-dioxygenase-like lactoylglutathione lyase family enzyme
MLALSLAKTVVAQAPDASVAKKARIENLILSVGDLDKSVAFYTALGLERKDAATQPKLPAPAPLSPILSQLTNIKGANFRSASFKIPGVEYGLVLNEFTKIERSPTHSRMQDPGSARFVIAVHDFNAMAATLKKLGGTVISKNGAAVPFKGDNAKEVGLYVGTVRDPDGFMIELMQFAKYRTHSRLVVGVGEMFNATRFYAEVFGLLLDPPFFVGEPKVVDFFFDPDPRVMDALDTPNSPSRYLLMRYRANADNLELIDYKDTVRKPFRPQLSDLGAAAISFIVPDIDAVVKATQSGGATVVSSGGQAVNGPQGAAVIVRDLDGFYLEAIQAPR